MKIWILCDNEEVSAYALEAISLLEGQPEIWIANCRSARKDVRHSKHFAYYALNILSMKGAFNRKRSIHEAERTFAGRVDFDALQEGAWQYLPRSLVDRIKATKADVILKFGLGLMKVPEDLDCPVLSYHHGNPAHFRGRPAGFWEIMTDTPVMGQIVQVLSDRLDAGRVVAYRETRVVSYSLRQTLKSAYALSPGMMNEAIHNACTGRDLGIRPTGRNYRLPTNGTVFAFAAKIAGNFIKRLIYGAFFEKAWRVATAPCSPDELARVVQGGDFPEPDTWRTLEMPRGYSFVADPFFSLVDDGIYLEAMSRRSGQGDILRMDASGTVAMIRDQGHCSYPMTVCERGQLYVVPETVEWQDLTVFQDAGSGLQPVAGMKVEGTSRVTDPTIFHWADQIWLAGNRAEARNALDLWQADSIFGRFRLHPASPIAFGPRGSRMGGRVLQVGDMLYRFGQDFTRDYGDGLLCFQVQALDAGTYEESLVGQIRFDHVKGPHTLDWKDGQLLFDWYEERFSLFAGLRRLRMVPPMPS